MGLAIRKSTIFIICALVFFLTKVAVAQDQNTLEPAQLESAKATGELSIAPQQVVKEVKKTAAATTTNQFEDINYSVYVDSQEARFNLGIYGQLSQFELGNQNLTGNAFEVVASYSVLPKLTVGLGITQAVDTTNGISLLYTGIRSALAYHIIGEAHKKSSILNVNGRNTISFLSGLRPSVSADFGIDQYNFNGSTQLVPATGMSFGAKFDHSFWILRLSWVARYGMLVINSESVSLITLGAGLTYRF